MKKSKKIAIIKLKNEFKTDSKAEKIIIFATFVGWI